MIKGSSPKDVPSPVWTCGFEQVKCASSEVMFGLQLPYHHGMYMLGSRKPFVESSPSHNYQRPPDARCASPVILRLPTDQRSPES